MVEWFRSFSEVPGSGYKSNPALYRPQLPEQALLPNLASYEIKGVRRDYFNWPMLFEAGTTSASPVKQWTTQPRSDESPAQTRLRQLYETLELPGELLDYHFAIQGCSLDLWKLRREESWIFAELEQICWLDIRLIQTYPNIVQVNNEPKFLLVMTLQYLISLYEQEGYLYEALHIAEIAATFGQQKPALERIKSRISNLEAEEAS